MTAAATRPDAEVGDADFVAIQRFLNREAALLDRRDYAAWRGLLTDDFAYRVTQRIVRDGDGRADYAIVDEDGAAFRLRIDQIADPKLTRAENPRTLTRRFVSGLQAWHADAPDGFEVRSSLLVHYARLGTPEGRLYAGEREDRLRRTADGLRLASRLVRLDHTTLFDGSMSILL